MAHWTALEAVLKAAGVAGQRPVQGQVGLPFELVNGARTTATVVIDADAVAFDVATWSMSENEVAVALIRVVS